MKIYLPKLFIGIAFCCAIFFSPIASAQTQNLSDYKISTKGFFENKGQIADQNNKPSPAVKYLFSSPGFNVQLRQTGFSYDTYTETPDSTTAQNEIVLPKGRKLPQSFTRHYHRVDIELVGGNPNAQLTAEGKSDAYYNYFTAGAPQGGVSNVHSYQKVIYKNIYPNIDLEFFISASTQTSIPVEYQFIVHPGGNPANIKLAYKGANKVGLDGNKLVVNVTAGDFTESIPSSYLKATGQAVKVNYAALGYNVFTFSLPNNIALTSDLVIDPVPNLVWGTYYGGTADDNGNAIAVDENSNVYITGSASSTTDIATLGAYQTTYGGKNDAFVAKFNPTGSALIWGTYYGGTSDDFGYAIAIDTGRNVYITGQTYSTTGIATTGAYQTTNTGGNDAFIAKFNSGGTSLLWGTYYGENGTNYGDGIAVDASQIVYVTGGTESTAGIASTGAYQTTNGGGANPYDAFVAKFNPALTGAAQLVWGTYYGGTGTDIAYGIALDKSDNICITGTTNSATRIATAGEYQTTFGDSSDAFIAKFNPSLSGIAQLVWGTYYGGDNFDYSNAIALDTNDNVYITGETVSADLPLSANAYDTTFSTQTVIGYGTAFVAKFNPTGTSLLWGTFYGNFSCPLPIYISPNISDYGIAIDKSGNAYITGQIMTGMCPLSNMTTANTYQATINAPEGATYSYVAKFNPTLSGTAQLVWGTYYGGTGDDYANGIALDTSDNAYITGGTSSSDGIATTGAYQTSLNGNGNAFVAKFSTNPMITVSITPNPNPAAYCPGGSATLTASGAITYTWSPSTGLSATTGSSVTANPTVTTTYIVSGIGLNDSSGMSSVVVTVYPNPTITATPNPPSYCTGESSTLKASGGSTYTWSPSTDLSATTGSSVTANPTVTTTYTVTGTNSNGCSATNTVTVIVDSILDITATPNPSSYCTGGSSILTASGGSTYTWSPATGLSATTGSSVTANPSVTTTYTVTGMNSSGCSGTYQVTVIVIASPNKPSFQQHGDTLISSSEKDNQWYRNDTLLINDTSQHLVITVLGDYWVVVNNEANGCSTSSDTMKITTLAGINLLSKSSNQLSIYPNPTSGQFTVILEGNQNGYSVEVYNVLGEKIYQSISGNSPDIINLSSQPPGLYFIYLKSEQGVEVGKVLVTK